MSTPPPTPPPRSVSDLEKLMDDRYAYTQSRFDELGAQMAHGLDSLRNMILNQSHHGDNSYTGGRNNGTPTSENNRNAYATHISKVEFPRFDGKSVRDWLYKCDQFFLLDGTPPTSMVRLASIHLDGLALQWHLNYMRHKFDMYPTWSQYVADVTTRFGDAYDLLF
jgi:hypothetical protein